MSKDVKFNINLSVNGKDVVVQCKQGVQELGKALGTIPGKAEQSRQAMIKWSAVSTIYNNLYNGLQQLTGAMQPFIAKSNAATEAQTKLTTVMRQRMHATEADTEAVNKAISAQTKLGVVGGTVQRSGLQQLATFASQRSTLLTLLPAMNNLVVQQRGLGATGEDAVGIANLMGKALMGNATAMRRVGITLADSQAEMIKYGNESERAKAIAEAITDNVGNMNAEMAKTDASKAKQLANTFGGLQVKVGRFFSEYQSYIASIGQIGMAVTAIGTVSSALRGLIGRLGLVTLATSSFRVVVSGLKSVLAAARIATVEMAVAEQLEGKGALAAAVSTTIFKTAIRGLMIATGVGAAIALLTMGIEALVNWLDNSSDSSEEAAAGMKKTVTAAEQAKSRMGDLAANGAAPLISKYEELRKKWQALTDDKKRLKFISDSANAFHSLGVRIGSVSEAEDFLVKSTDKVRQALYARAEAAAAAQVAQEEYEKALRADIAAKDEESKARQGAHAELWRQSAWDQHYAGRQGLQGRWQGSERGQDGDDGLRQELQRHGQLCGGSRRGPCHHGAGPRTAWRAGRRCQGRCGDGRHRSDRPWLRHIHGKERGAWPVGMGSSRGERSRHCGQHHSYLERLRYGWRAYRSDVERRQAAFPRQRWGDGLQHRPATEALCHRQRQLPATAPADAGSEATGRGYRGRVAGDDNQRARQAQGQRHGAHGQQHAVAGREDRKEILTGHWDRRLFINR